MNTSDISLPNQEETPEPLVSILVPSYNHEKYVIECLDSIRNVDYPRLELLVSDDCSQDGTFHMAQRGAITQVDLSTFSLSYC